MPTPTRYPREPPSPLDLGDIRKTQRRVAALLQVSDKHWLRGKPTSHRHVPHSFCYVCSKLDPDGRFMGNPYKYLFGRGYLQRCDHVPPTPHPTILNDTRPPSPSDPNRLFDTGILNKDELPLSNSTKFKMAPAFDNGNIQDYEDGRFLPFISENTFLTTNPVTVDDQKRKSKARLSLPSLPDERNLASRDLERDSTGSVNNSRYVTGRRGSYSIGDKESGIRVSDRRRSNKDRKTKEAFTNSSGLSPWGGDEAAEGRLKYKHRENEGWVKLAGPSRPYGEDDFLDESFKKDRDREREGTFEFKRRGTFSVTPPGSYSREITGSSEGSFIFSRIQSASWCECPEVDSRLLRCTECFQTGGHEKWCVSKMGICPNCGKPVRRKNINNRRGRQKTLSPSQSPRKSGTDLSLKSHGHNREECSSRRREDKNVRFHDRNSFVKEGKVKKGSVLKKNKNFKSSLSDRSDSKSPLGQQSNPSLPSVDPNIHRQAYALALAESRVRKMRKDAFALENASQRRYFSYFPLYKHPMYKPHPNPSLGIRQGDEDVKTLKIKKGMKHILGDVNIDDYYPSRKGDTREDSIGFTRQF